MRTTTCILLSCLATCTAACGGDSTDETGGAGGAGGLGGAGGAGGPGEPGLATIDDLQPTGAFRFQNGDFGVSNVNYAVGVLAYNPDNHSLFIAGHAQHNAVAEYPIVESGTQTEVADLPETGEPLQPFVSVLEAVDNPEALDRVTGMLWVDGALIVNAETWYDAAADNQDTTLVLADADDLAGAADGYFELDGAAHSAGYLGPIPVAWQDALGADHYTGWSSVYSIVSRYSVGPSLWTFDPDDLLGGSASSAPQISATATMNYAYGGTLLSEGALDWAAQGEAGPFPPADPLWNPLSRGRYGFFVPGTRTFAVIGSTAGLETGIGYKAIQEDGGECGGPCAYGPEDYYNYYWLFDVEEILAADNVFDPQPYDYGIWEVPFDDGGQHPVIGATFDPEGGVLYVALGNAGQIGDYDRPPVIVTYALP
ncbi:MAG: hypothetical protein JRI68_30720 [Deltaproteobacteria bacterium]|nr:hypothetical protein [Deltaproteobacteria bacterium]